MSEKIKLIDVTLRSMIHDPNFYFNTKTIGIILSYLSKANIDYVEVGERNSVYNNNQDVGLVATCPKEYLNFCRKNLHNSKLTVIIHPQNIFSNDLPEMSSAKVDAINIYFDYEHPFITFKVIEELKAYNFELFVTLPKVSKLSLEKLDEHIRNLVRSGITQIFLEDTNGSLVPSRIPVICNSLDDKNISLGLQAQDHLGLAVCNAITAIEKGAKFISSALYGIGKYNGVLRTEVISTFLHLSGHNQYILYELYEAAEYVKDHLYNSKEELIIQNMINASFDLSPEDEVDPKLIQAVKDFFKTNINFRNNKTNHKSKLN